MRLTIVILFASMLSACSPSVSSTWTAFAYPNGTMYGPTIILEGFDSLQNCQAATRVILDLSGNREGASSECGFKCKPYFGGVQMCQETVD
jgi:hypothetical protein